ncbi:hypothetical protein QIS74_11934 [Colletotrichum tabaci]|uniref:Uncharacterized protein n=1 Tax=Colletotrichum tabaci TaxID=1209068 RepID=A0AAV9T1W4_9PEZI
MVLFQTSIFMAVQIFVVPLLLGDACALLAFRATESTQQEINTGVALANIIRQPYSNVLARVENNASDTRRCKRGNVRVRREWTKCPIEPRLVSDLILLEIGSRHDGGPTLMSSDGNPVPHEGLVLANLWNNVAIVLPPGNGGGCVTRSPFSSMPVRLGPQAMPSYGNATT